MLKLRSVSLLVISVALALVLASAAAADSRFGRPAAAALPGKHLLDVGVVDYDGDGFLDLFTTNHKFHSALLRNDGAGGFVDELAATGFSPSPAFPGLEIMRPPAIGEDGLYVYISSADGKASRSYVHIRSVGTAASGKLTFASKAVDVERDAGADVHVGRSEAGQPSVEFEARPGAVIDIATRHIDLPIAASFDGLPARQIRVGSGAVRADESSFLLTLRDRHGLAFADIGGDRATDVFAVSGGLGGGIMLPGFRGQVQDEMLIRRDGRFTNEAEDSGLLKGACRGREAAAVDVDGDGRIDLFEGCEERVPRLYLQSPGGGFTRTPAPAGIASTYRWVDIGGDSRPELLSAEPDGIAIYRFGQNGSRLVQRVRGNARNGKVAQFAVADIDTDGDLDVLAVSGSGSTLFESRAGKLQRLRMGPMGLPGRSVAASFVDYDNDGRLDLHLIPQGLFRRGGPRDFNKTGLEATGDVGAAITTWFDYDNDGLRDPLVVTGTSAFSNRKALSRARNLGPGGHWLEIDLDGPAGNAEGIGARVQVRCEGRRQFGFVGQSDDSRYSQGHYRLYFGLGTCARVGSVTVRWADGTRSEFGPMQADRLRRLSYAAG